MIRRTSRRLPAQRESEISDLAEAVAVNCLGRIDPLRIARSLGITTSFGDYGNAFDGMLEAAAGKFHIFCNLNRVETRDSPRARFTLAHELGHYYIDEHRCALLSGRAPSHPSFCDYSSPHLVEVEADSFASALLMPWSRFRSAAVQAKRGLPGIVELASFFQASVTATALRYLQADLFPCVVVKWDASGYCWKRLSQSAYATGLRKTVERLDRLPRDCPTSRVLRQGAGLAEAGTTKAAWFPFVSSASESNSIFLEQAISLGRFGVLTFLFPA
jgi:Zn-dependent peptidase ImmA (M78 family)